MRMWGIDSPKRGATGTDPGLYGHDARAVSSSLALALAAAGPGIPQVSIRIEAQRLNNSNLEFNQMRHSEKNPPRET